jgi:hypothetical protein
MCGAQPESVAGSDGPPKLWWPGYLAAALLVSTWKLVPDLVTTLAAIIGFGVFTYGVYLGWQLFYDREPDGPAS